METSTAYVKVKCLLLQINADLVWPDDAVAAVTGLEKVAFDTLGSDMHKYNLKMRQLEFNLKVVMIFKSTQIWIL